jgi:beta-glucosidase
MAGQAVLGSEIIPFRSALGMPRNGLIGLAWLIVFVNVPLVHAQFPQPDSPAIEQRVNRLLGELSLEEKIELIGMDGLFTRAQPKIGLPRLKTSDGPMGVRTWGPATAYAGGIALAASWDPALAERLGHTMGRDARARGVHFLLAPAVNIYRAPMDGRNFEYMGEDPFLAGRLAVSFIDGVQSEGVVATVKHFAANNSEFDRHKLNSVVDERTLREIYLPAFEAAVAQAHVGSIMDSYNLVNGEHSTQNAHLNNDILKKDWGFKGILMSDDGATYDGVAAANGGLDLENPSGRFMNAGTLLPAIKQGKVATAVIDDKVRRLLFTAIRFGFLDRDQTDLSIPLYSQADRQAALQSAKESIVLLKNEENLLPLDRTRMQSIAVIGPDAWPAVPGGGGSSQTTPFASTSLLTGLSDELKGSAKVVYVRGLPSLEEVCKETKFQDGFKEATFNNKDFSGAPVATGAMDHLWNFRPLPSPASSSQTFSIRWNGSYLPEKSGKYLFLIAAHGSDTYQLLIDGKSLLQETAHEGQAPKAGELTLLTGKPVAIQLDYRPATSGNISFGIRAVDDLVAPEALKLAAMADVTLVTVGFDPTAESEGFDRTFELPWGQEQLIRAVAAANPKTIVSITAGGGVAMKDWIDKVSAVIHNWYPGQEGGTALAEILLGERSPEGKLPVSFEKTWEQNPVHDNYYPAATAPGGVPTVHYAEGVFLGYRYYTTQGVEPQFPFGFGLSYTTFSFRNLRVSPSRVLPSSPVSVSFDVTNTGKREGAEVAQLYVGDPSARVRRPMKELKGFEKVYLEPGDTKRVTLVLDRRALSYWSEERNDWEVDPGKFVIFVGDSSENTSLSSVFTVDR